MKLVFEQDCFHGRVSYQQLAIWAMNTLNQVEQAVVIIGLPNHTHFPFQISNKPQCSLWNVKCAELTSPTTK
jgi:hypothetical protein